MTSPTLTNRVAIPAKLYFRIGDVAELLGIKPYVLRYWESEFPMITPEKATSGQRVYRRKDVEVLAVIKHLLYEERYSIEGARKKIRELRKEGELQAFKDEIVQVSDPEAILNLQNTEFRLAEAQVTELSIAGAQARIQPQTEVVAMESTGAESQFTESQVTESPTADAHAHELLALESQAVECQDVDRGALSSPRAETSDSGLAGPDLLGSLDAPLSHLRNPTLFDSSEPVLFSIESYRPPADDVELTSVPEAAPAFDSDVDADSQIELQIQLDTALSNISSSKESSVSPAEIDDLAVAGPDVLITIDVGAALPVGFDPEVRIEVPPEAGPESETDNGESSEVTLKTTAAFVRDDQNHTLVFENDLESASVAKTRSPAAVVARNEAITSAAQIRFAEQLVEMQILADELKTLAQRPISELFFY